MSDGPRPPDDVTLRHRFAVDDAALSRLHALAFGKAPGATDPWRARLERHSVAWVGAFAPAGTLVGFVHAVWDGGRHAFLLDAVVAPSWQRRRLGGRLAAALVDDVRAAGCEWLHVDFEPHLQGFYASCGFRPTGAGLVRLR